MSLMKPICTRATERDLVPDINPVAFKYSYLQTPNPTINYPLPWYCGISTKDSTGPFTYETNQVSLILARMQNALWCIGTAALKSQVALYPHPKYPRSCDRPQVRVLQKKRIFTQTETFSTEVPFTGRPWLATTIEIRIPVARQGGCQGNHVWFYNLFAPVVEQITAVKRITQSFRESGSHHHHHWLCLSEASGEGQLVVSQGLPIEVHP